MNDYELTRYELDEADELCHCNQIEIQNLNAYIELLHSLLQQNGIDYPSI